MQVVNRCFRLRVSCVSVCVRVLYLVIFFPFARMSLVN